MSSKRITIILLAVLMLMSFMLTGCRDRNNDENTNAPQGGESLPGGEPDDPSRVPPPNEPQPERPDDPFAPPIGDAPQRPGTQPDDPNRPPPERNPDGSIG